MTDACWAAWRLGAQKRRRLFELRMLALAIGLALTAWGGP